MTLTGSDAVKMMLHVMKFRSPEYLTADVDIVIRHDGIRYGPYSSAEHASMTAGIMGIPLDCIKVEPRPEKDKADLIRKLQNLQEPQ